MGSYEGDKKREGDVFLKSSFCSHSFFLSLLIYRGVSGTSSQAVGRDGLKDSLMQLVPAVFEWDPVALTVCSIIIYIPCSDQTRTRTKDTYLSSCFPVSLKQDLDVCICHFSVLALCCVSLCLTVLICPLFPPNTIIFPLFSFRF